ncbi:hypothetical protein FA95DRAFT_1613825 [Auriscalpium vulgare]|uniref:Uncharacterized protein n=1 Tax=Auriscalpium vulgare TaxID=40419 RepID=A0ACB8R193_9AGAM|nr:hypothetical protein FA95DRAFT_1613825 [Auriscalpium vulgare]
MRIGIIFIMALILVRWYIYLNELECCLTDVERPDMLQNVAGLRTRELSPAPLKAPTGAFALAPTSVLAVAAPECADGQPSHAQGELKQKRETHDREGTASKRQHKVQAVPHTATSCAVVRPATPDADVWAGVVKTEPGAMQRGSEPMQVDGDAGTGTCPRIEDPHGGWAPVRNLPPQHSREPPPIDLESLSHALQHIERFNATGTETVLSAAVTATARCNHIVAHGLSAIDAAEGRRPSVDRQPRDMAEPPAPDLKSLRAMFEEIGHRNEESEAAIRAAVLDMAGGSNFNIAYSELIIQVQGRRLAAPDF